MQQPRPPVWVATLRTDGGARIGARGLPAMFIPYASAETQAEMAAGLGAYRAAFVAAGGRAADASAPFGLHAFCADTIAEARAEARPAMERYVRTRLYAVQRPFETLVDQDVVAVGDPYELLRVARRYAEACFTHFPAIVNFGGIPHKRVLRSMERGQARPSPLPGEPDMATRVETPYTQRARYYSSLDGFNIQKPRIPAHSSAPSATGPSIPPRPPGSSPATSRSWRSAFPPRPLVLARYARIRAGERWPRASRPAARSTT